MSESFVTVILNREKQPCGMGMVIDSDTVLTCAHVVNNALGRAGDAKEQPTDATVDVTFAFSRGERKGKIAHWYPPGRLLDLDDICVLRLNSSVPADVAAATFSPTEHGRDFKACRRTGPASPVEWGYGRIVDQADSGYHQVERLAGKPFLSKGHSGSPAICVRTGHVLGMVVRVIPETEQGHIASTQSIQKLFAPRPRSSGKSKTWAATGPGFLVLWLLTMGGATLGYWSLWERVDQSNAQAIALKTQLEKEVHGIKKEFNDVPAAFYHCTTGAAPINSDQAGGTIIDFSTCVYDTHRAENVVTTGGNWKYTAPKSGIYSVSALAIFTQRGKGNGGIALAVYRDGKALVQLAQFMPSSGESLNVEGKPVQGVTSVTNRTIGGTADIELGKGEAIDIRINKFYEVQEATLASAGATWFSIHYVGPADTKKK